MNINVCSAISYRQIFLSTTSVEVQDLQGNNHTCRALLDSASQANFITEALCTRFGTKKIPMVSPIFGINGQSSQVSCRTNLARH